MQLVMPRSIVAGDHELSFALTRSWGPPRLLNPPSADVSPAKVLQTRTFKLYGYSTLDVVLWKAPSLTLPRFCHSWHPRWATSERLSMMSAQYVGTISLE